MAAWGQPSHLKPKRIGDAQQTGQTASPQPPALHDVSLKHTPSAYDASRKPCLLRSDRLIIMARITSSQSEIGAITQCITQPTKSHHYNKKYFHSSIDLIVICEKGIT